MYWNSQINYKTYDALTKNNVATPIEIMLNYWLYDIYDLK